MDNQCRIMPEAPEVAYLVDQLSQFKGSSLQKLTILKGRYQKHGPPQGYDEFINDFPLTLMDVQKKGKTLLFYFENDWILVSKLGLQGWWYSDKKPEWFSGTPNIELRFNNKTLYYHDPVSYGTLEFTHTFQNALAPEFESVSYKELMNRLSLKKSILKKPIGEALMDQHGLVSGIGNYLRAEVLYDAKISPKRLVDSLSTKDWKQFIASSKKVFRRQFKHLNNVETYLSHMKVYGKKEDPLGNPVEMYRTKDKRMVHWVPSIQR